MIFDKETKTYTEGKIQSSKNCTDKTRHPHVEEWNWLIKLNNEISV